MSKHKDKDKDEKDDDHKGSKAENGGKGSKGGDKGAKDAAKDLRAKAEELPGLMADAAAGAVGKLVGSSRVDLQACKLEYSIVSPK